MSSFLHLRAFISGRLTAAAEEIFTELERTIEEELDRQRRLLDVTWKPEIDFHTADVPQQPGWKEEELSDQQICNQEDFSLDQEEPEPPRVKEELEFCSSQEGQKPDLKKENDSMATPIHHHGDLGEEEPSAEQPLCFNSPLTTSTRQEESRAVSFRSTGDEMRPKKKVRVCSPASETLCRSKSQKKPLKCDICGKAFRNNHDVEEHYRIHAGVTAYGYQTCSTSFSQSENLLAHIRVHKGQNLQFCETCGKGFTKKSGLLSHMTIHTGQTSHFCKICGRCFTRKSSLLTHMTIHTGEKSHGCNTCGKSFSRRSSLLTHTRIHTGEKPYPCRVCGKTFMYRNTLSIHMKVHSA